MVLGAVAFLAAACGLGPGREAGSTQTADSSVSVPATSVQGLDGAPGGVPAGDVPGQLTERPSLLDYSNVITSGDVLGVPIGSSAQLRDVVSTTVVARFVDVELGAAPQGVAPTGAGVLHLAFAVETVLGGRRPPVQSPGSGEGLLTVSVRLDCSPGEATDAVEVLKAHRDERYLLFLTPESDGAGVPTGRYALAPFAPYPVLVAGPDRRFEPVSSGEELVRASLEQAARRNGSAEPVVDDPVDERLLLESARSTYLADVLTMDVNTIGPLFSAPVGRTAEEIGLGGDPAVDALLERFADLGPDVVELDLGI